MTVRNFRVKNGISIGDVTIDAATNKITGLSTSAPSAAGDVATKQYVDDSTSGLSATTIQQGNSSLVVADSGTGTITATVDGNTELQITDDGVTIYGNLSVQGTETIVDTQNLSVDDNIISINSGISAAANMPQFSGLHFHRGTGSSATELDLFWVWDETYTVSGGSTLGGTFTALGSTHSESQQTPNSDFTLADIRCNVVEATATTAQYADIAERFESDAPITPGAVVMLGGDKEITETSQDLSDRVFGVISTQPAYMMNNKAGDNDTHPFVAMTGRTPVRVTGECRKGDRLVSSSVKGTARAVAEGETINPFHVIGRALEDKFDDAIGLVNCVVRTNN